MKVLYVIVYIFIFYQYPFISVIKLFKTAQANNFCQWCEIAFHRNAFVYVDIFKGEFVRVRCAQSYFCKFKII